MALIKNNTLANRIALLVILIWAISRKYVPHSDKQSIIYDSVFISIFGWWLWAEQLSALNQYSGK